MRRSHSSVHLAAVAVVWLFAAAIPNGVRAQTDTATIRGAVSDPTGAVIPAAVVRAIDLDRGAIHTATTGDTGRYAIAGVRPGHYRLEVEKSGFKLARVTAITVNVLDALERDFTLEVGPIADSVTVEGGAPTLNTSDGAV